MSGFFVVILIWTDVSTAIAGQNERRRMRHADKRNTGEIERWRYYNR